MSTNDTIARAIGALAFVLCAPFLARAQVQAERAPTADELARATWVEGRVARHPATPADEALRVVADAAGAAEFDKHQVAVDADGRFRVAFARDCQRGRLRILGRYSYSSEDFAWKAGDETTGIVLEAALGAALIGRCVLPRDEPALRAEFTRQSVQLEGTPTTPGKNGIARVAWIREDLTFEFGALPEGFEYTLELAIGPFVPIRVEDLGLDAGRSRLIDLPLEIGATLRGTVVDESGAPVAGARLAITSDGAGLLPPPRDAQDLLRRTRADGAFEIRGVRPGSARLWATREGLLSVTQAIADLKSEEVRGDLRVLLKLGGVVSGRTLFPDGRPAAGARLTLVQPRGADLAPDRRQSIAGADGSFRVTGLTDAKVALDAELEVRAEGQKPRTFRARIGELASDISGLVVTLEAGLALEGRVMDDIGRAVLSYQVGAIQVGGPPRAPGRTVSRDVKTSDGTFSWDGFEPGEWDVYVYGRGIVYEPARRVRLPSSGSPLLFVVRRPATVAGFVRARNGDGVPGAVVEVHWDRPALVGGNATTDQKRVKSGLDGRFELDEVYPGTVRLSARHADGRVSETVPVALESGAIRSDVVLVLGP